MGIYKWKYINGENKKKRIKATNYKNGKHICIKGIQNMKYFFLKVYLLN